MNQKDILRAMARIKGSKEYLVKRAYHEVYRESAEAVEDFDIIIACMELQVGKKPLFKAEVNGQLFYVCLACELGLIVRGYKNCANCGQRILWEVEDDE